MKEALLYEKLSNGVVRCDLCAHHCRIAPGELGICQVRKNIDDVLYTLVDDHVISRHIDPVEKSHSFTFTLDQRLTLSQHQAATSDARGARTGRSPRCRANNI